MKKWFKLICFSLLVSSIQLVGNFKVQAECDFGGMVTGKNGSTMWMGDSLEALLVADSLDIRELDTDVKSAFVHYQYQVRQDVIHHGKRTDQSDKLYLSWRELFEAREQAQQVLRVNFALDKLLFGNSNSRYFFGSYITSIRANWVACEHIEGGKVKKSFTLETLDVNMGDHVRVLHAILMPPMR